MAQLLTNIILSFSLYLLLSISFQFIYYPTKFFHFAHAAIISIGAYITYLFYFYFNFPLFIAILLSIIVSSLFGISIEYFIYRPLRKKNVLLLIYLITSIGLYIIFQNLISLIFGDDSKSLYTGEIIIGHDIFGGFITTIQIIIISSSLLLFILLILFSKYSSIGKAIRAVSVNPELANILGINSNNIILSSFAIGSALGALIGILFAIDTNLTPTMGFNLLLYGVIVMIIGGIGSYKGLIYGAILVASSQHIASFYIDTKWTNTIVYIILILFLIWKPLGFSGQRLKKVEI